MDSSNDHIMLLKWFTSFILRLLKLKTPWKTGKIKRLNDSLVALDVVVAKMSLVFIS